jgi:NAD(P)-dependent dehydrogenase (short-subunit alcohol dehydrogenase family)
MSGVGRSGAMGASQSWREREMISKDLDSKRVLVTAGGSGIGRAVASRFAAVGSHVHICDVVESFLDESREQYPDIGVTLADVADPAAVDRLFDDVIAGLGGLDFLVTCAGIAGPTAVIEEITYGDWQETIGVNLTGSFLCARRAVPLLKRNRRGSIVFMSSNLGLMGAPRRSPYVSAKWALTGLTRALAMELGSFSIRVNAICPGNVDGERMDRVIAASAAARGISPEEVRTELVNEASLGEFQSPDDIANMVLYLCSSSGAAISGQAIAVDGHVDHQ